MRPAIAAIVLLCCVTPLRAETREENGVRVHRANPAATLSSARAEAAPPVSITLDPTYGARASCTSMDWRLSVSRETWESACGDYGYDRWYDRWIYRRGY